MDDPSRGIEFSSTKFPVSNSLKRLLIFNPRTISNNIIVFSSNKRRKTGPKSNFKVKNYRKKSLKNTLKLLNKKLLRMWEDKKPSNKRHLSKIA